MKKKLLLADDSITIQKVIAITFSSDDYALTVVDNGNAALDKARAERPDLIMADVFMPGKNGYEVCAAVRSDPTLQGVPVLLLTGTFEPFDEAKARQVGATKWIAKPFESQGLIDCVEDLLAKAGQTPVAPASAPVKPAAAPVAATAAAPARPMPGAPVPPPPVAVASPAAPAARPMPGAPAAAAMPPAAAVPVHAPSAPEAGPVLDDDIWGGGDDLAASFGELSGTDEFAPDPAVQTGGTEDDLWGSVSFEEAPPAIAVAEIEPAAADSWGSLEEDFGEIPAASLPEATEIPMADTSMWGEIEEDLTSPQPEPMVPVTVSGWDSNDDMLPLDEVEILEEVDLTVPETASPEPVMSDAGGMLELSGFEEMSQDEVLWEEPATAAVSLAPAGVVSEAAETEPFMEEAFADAAGTAIAARPAPVAVEQRVTALSEEELSRIVERVSGEVIERLAGTILEKIAWEVVPDLAESLIKAELRKIRDEVEARR